MRALRWVKRKLLPLHYSFFDMHNFCPGSSIFPRLLWCHKYRTNVPLLCWGRRVSQSINKTLLDLLLSLFSRLTRLSPLSPESAFNITHHKQYPIWTVELWKHTARVRRGGGEGGGCRWWKVNQLCEQRVNGGSSLALDLCDNIWGKYLEVFPQSKREEMIWVL